MTRQDTLKLDSYHLRHAIADKLGCWHAGDHWWFPDLVSGCLVRWDVLPKWDWDIAQVWSLEEMLHDNQHELYAHALNWVINRNPGRCQRWDLVHATPDQRARAWLIVKNEER